MCCFRENYISNTEIIIKNTANFHRGIHYFGKHKYRDEIFKLKNSCCLTETDIRVLQPI